MELWFTLSDMNMGETYSVWKDGECIIGGAWDPDDYISITETVGLSHDDIKKWISKEV